MYTELIFEAELSGDTPKDVIDALSRSLSNAEDIQGYSEFMNVFDTIYSKTLEYYSNILSFDSPIISRISEFI